MDQVPGSYLEARHAELVQRLSRVVSDPRVLGAFREVERHLFVSEVDRERAYEDRALPWLEGQTISQPSMIAIMLEALRTTPSDRALEVGAGSGYAAALLSKLVREVHAIEIRPSLLTSARAAIASAHIENVVFHAGDGSRGLADLAPFDRILVSAAAHEVPAGMLEQLSPGGRIAIPVGGDRGQLLRVGSRNSDGRMNWEDRTPCLFVPLVGA